MPLRLRVSKLRVLRRANSCCSGHCALPPGQTPGRRRLPLVGPRPPLRIRPRGGAALSVVCRP
eukprot:5635791-Lingulodinium_polyedra.AAC.1